jgi:hypothetical protein
MDVHIDDIISTVRTVDGEALLSPQIMQQIVRTVLQAVRQDQAHGERVRVERSFTVGEDEQQHRL